MKVLYQTIQAHRGVAWGVMIGFSVFIGCCVFPAVNLPLAFPAGKFTINFIFATNLFTALIAYSQLGILLGALFQRGTFLGAMLLNLALAGAGMACRFLLEFGEVSNTYNFTWPNVGLHLLISVVFCSMMWLHSTKLAERST